MCKSLMIMDLVFSLDNIITTVGLAGRLWVMPLQ
ncbi:MAG: hypothetical protein IPN13_12680 [Bacteroidetes bacterium]|nr:hypothetical protein [Bacteroidota bacterium]